MFENDTKQAVVSGKKTQKPCHCLNPEIKSEVMSSTTNRLGFTLARPTWNDPIQSMGLKQRRHL